jgi:hypothetical protein
MSYCSIWQKGIPQNQDLVQGNLRYVNYIFPIDDQGNGWEIGSSGSQTGLFDLSRIKAWELVFNHLPTEEQSTNFQKIIFHRVFASNDENSLLSNIKLSVDDWNSKDGDITWESSFYTFGDGLTARFSSGGDLWESVSIHPKTSIDVIQTAYHIDILSSYANPIYDAVAVQLTMADGSLWQQSFSLPFAGRHAFKFQTTCHLPIFRCVPNLGWQVIPWGPIPTDTQFKATNIVDWSIVLNTPPAGDHEIHLQLHR